MISDAKTYYNPLNGEYTKILESSADTNGEYSLLEVYLMPGGGNPPHYHTRFTEEFFAVEGRLGLLYKKDTLYLEPGQNCLVPIGAEHRFFNDGSEPIVFRIVLRSGQPGFENFIKGLFGLVNDGKTTKSMIPNNPLFGATLLHWGDTHLNNFTLKFLVRLQSWHTVWLNYWEQKKNCLTCTAAINYAFIE